MKTPWNDTPVAPHKALAHSVLALVVDIQASSEAVSHAPHQRTKPPRISGLIARLREWRAVRQTRQLLHSLSDHQLRDIGLERSDIDDFPLSGASPAHATVLVGERKELPDEYPTASPDRVACCG